MHELKLTDTELKMLAEMIESASAPAKFARTLADLRDKIVALVNAATG